MNLQRASKPRERGKLTGTVNYEAMKRREPKLNILNLQNSESSSSVRSHTVHGQVPGEELIRKPMKYTGEISEGGDEIRLVKF